MNAIGVIAPYKYKGMWVFDDAAVGLHREPFVAGIDAGGCRIQSFAREDKTGGEQNCAGTPTPFAELDTAQ